MTQGDANDSHWGNAANWNGWMYFSKEDTRLWVPKRYGFGWTLNLGHQYSPWLMAGLVVLPPLAVAVAGASKDRNWARDWRARF